MASSPGHPQGDGGRPHSNITAPSENRIAHPTKPHYQQYAQYEGKKFRPRNYDTMESMSQMGPSELQHGMGGLDAANAPKVNGGWHDSSARKDGKKGEPDHLNVEYQGRQWHVERDGSHSAVKDGNVERYPSEDAYAQEQTHVKRESEGGGTFWTRRGN